MNERTFFYAGHEFIKILDLEDTRLETQIDRHLPDDYEGGPEESIATALSVDGTIAVAEGHRVQLFQIHNMQTHEFVGYLEGHDKAVNSLVFTPNGGKLVSGSRDGTVAVWDINKIRFAPSKGRVFNPNLSLRGHSVRLFLDYLANEVIIELTGGRAGVLMKLGLRETADMLFFGHLTATLASGT
jgi:WD40 repeat protein